MNPPDASSTAMSETERHSALFTGLVMQQANMAMMFLGQVPRPDRVEQPVDLEAASLFVDTLEMLEAKTAGHLNPAEQELLKSTLTSVRFAFVQAAERGPAAPAHPPAPAVSSASPSPEPSPAAEAKAADDDKRRFVKKY